jgi:hypothetical protein
MDREEVAKNPGMRSRPTHIFRSNREKDERLRNLCPDQLPWGKDPEYLGFLGGFARPVWRCLLGIDILKPVWLWETIPISEGRMTSEKPGTSGREIRLTTLSSCAG